MAETRRADGRRNHELLLAAGRAAFDELGTEVSLREVARRAGVGIGTLYRHFPTREALLEAAMRHGLDALRAEAEELLDAPSTQQALFDWLAAFAVGSTRYQGLPASILAALQDEASDLHRSCAAMRAAAATLLTRAQQAGEVRADLTVNDLLALVAGIAWAGQQAGGAAEGRTERLLAVVRSGIEQR
ncbi:TetR/AcrR family transcriptional regulator [Kitasatospora sp. NBC_01287]|uniref:TetR/AcrR family transcriptional regulator n=1 Tax=Kitasatospora sp. NBC_01287 TaxID=2903573 RepID=UPI0022537F6A|nr:TetR/AcrR family transcriptional regulator [Kitasatospora sp. NBC_01287]MCX4750736.1 TetR/AcrR family transcriptional regulator [Kitasatospora sp. NBC_01287]